MSSRSNPWPRCPEPEHMFAKALLVHGPVPEKGWSVTRNAAGRVTYAVARGKEARAFQAGVLDMFAEDAKKRYRIREWKVNHCINVARKWKNEFYVWMWEQIDASKSGD